MIGGEFFFHRARHLPSQPRAPFAAGKRPSGGSSQRNPETPGCPGVREEKASPEGGAWEADEQSSHKRG